MKKHLLFTLIILLLLMAGTALADGTYGTTVKSDSVNLRAAPTTSSAKVATYSRGSWMTILGESGNWYQVRGFDGNEGYMSKNYVQVSSYSYGQIGKVNNPSANGFLNLRSSPSYTSQVKGIYYNGVVCSVQSQTNGWLHVNVNGVDGYFRKEYVTLSNGYYSNALATVISNNGGAVNLRVGPASMYTSVAQIKKGTVVFILQEGKDWWRVSANGYVGFMSTSYLKRGLEQGGPDAVVTPVPVSPTPVPTTGTGYAVVSNPRANQVLNLRERASVSSRSLGKYANGTTLTVLQQGKQWCKVRTSAGRVGYMMTSYLNLYNLPATATKTVYQSQGTYVNLRASNSMNSSVLVKVPHGASVIVLAPGDTWYRVKYGNYTGYMLAAFLK